jgi:hypothetical protein
MRETMDRKEIGCEAIHVGDCYVWAEIYSLDSRTDYREYISNDVSQPTTETGTEFITLDNAWFSWRAVAKSLAAFLTTLLALRQEVPQDGANGVILHQRVLRWLTVRI